MTDPSKLNVLFLASESDPLIKIGGLGDVAGSLPRALRTVSAKSGLSSPDLDIRLMIPFHPGIRTDVFPSRPLAEFKIRSIYREILVRAFTLNLDGLPVYLIGGAPIDQETAVYTSDLETDAYKYVFFSLAALELTRQMGWKPDILHANDWHTSAAVYSLALNRPSDPFFKQTVSVLTIHNLPYLGAMSSSALAAFDLPPALNTSLPTWATHMALPLGLLTADAIVAVSPGYAKEIMTDEFGSGLQSFLRARSEKIIKWDPSTDAELVANYSPSNLQARQANKSFLQEELGLDVDPHIPLLSMITRMDPQKGVDLSVNALHTFLQSSNSDLPSVQAVFLGSGNRVIEQQVRRLELDFPQQIRARITYNERLSHHIYAGADMFLMPSRYEPCGLSQMIAMHYGCIPIARATGGLSDTIQDASNPDLSTGFLFKQVSHEALVATIQRALIVYNQDPQSWNAMQIRGMQRDFSWDRSAVEYLHRYQLLSNKRIYV
jgi:starch synthase